MTHHENILQLFDIYVKENEKFVEKGIKVSATRARKALAELVKASKERRKEIQESKTNNWFEFVHNHYTMLFYELSRQEIKKWQILHLFFIKIYL